MVAAIFSFVFKGETLRRHVSVPVVQGVRLDDVRGTMQASPLPACCEKLFSAPEIVKFEVSRCSESVCVFVLRVAC